MMNTKSEVFQFTIPLVARIKAEKFSRYHSQAHKAKQVYLNTLAISTVNSYLNLIGWATNLETSDSHNPVLQTIMDVADLDLPSYGKIECCGFWSGQDAINIAPEVWSGRIAYVVVEIEKSLNHAQILGFIRQVKQTELPLNQLESLAQFPAYLSQQRCLEVPPILRLNNWFSGLLAPGWQKMEDLFSPTQSLNFRSSPRLTDLTADRLSSTVDGVKLIQLPGSIDYSVALILKVQPESREEFNISIIVCNELSQEYLPEGLELVILDEVNRPVMIAQTNQTETIEFCFSGKRGENFSIEMSLDEYIHLESFII